MVEVTRRQAIAGAAATAVTTPFVNRNAFAGAPGRTCSTRAVDLVRRSVVIDMLAPLKIEAAPPFYTVPPSDKDLAEVVGSIVDHVDHVVKLVGIDHVGIGTDSDLNGCDDVSPEMNKALRGAYKDSHAFREKIDVEGFDHPRKMFDLTEELIRRRYSDANIRAILGGNFQRLLTATWSVGEGGG